MVWVCAAALAQPQLSPHPGAEQAEIVGVWRGHSVCMVKASPCRDEVNVYHVSAIPEKPGSYFVSGNKIVDGKEEVMGTGEWNYDAETHTLSYEFPRGVFRLKIEGAKMDGDLKLPDGTLYRQIFLHREK
jgi:hypothetical protein